MGHGQFAYGRALDKGRIGQTPNKKAEHTEALQKTPRFQHDTVWGLYDIPDEVRWACRRRAGIGEWLL